MLQFNTDSWHYRLVLYVFGDSFFTEKDKIDFDATNKTHQMVWTRKPRVVNFCPYCRAVVASITLLPIAWIKRKLPRKEKKYKPFDAKKSKRNLKIIKICAMFGIGLFGVHQLVVGNYGLAMFHFSIASFQIWGTYFFKWYGKWYEKRMDKKHKNKKPQSQTKKNPSLIIEYLHSNHSKICPAVAFVDKNDTETRV